VSKTHHKSSRKRRSKRAPAPRRALQLTRLPPGAKSTHSDHGPFASSARPDVSNNRHFTIRRETDNSGYRSDLFRFLAAALPHVRKLATTAMVCAVIAAFPDQAKATLSVLVSLVRFN